MGNAIFMNLTRLNQALWKASNTMLGRILLTTIIVLSLSETLQNWANKIAPDSRKIPWTVQKAWTPDPRGAEDTTTALLLTIKEEKIDDDGVKEPTEGKWGDWWWPDSVDNLTHVSPPDVTTTSNYPVWILSPETYPQTPEKSWLETSQAWREIIQHQCYVLANGKRVAFGVVGDTTLNNREISTWDRGDEGHWKVNVREGRLIRLGTPLSEKWSWISHIQKNNSLQMLRLIRQFVQNPFYGHKKVTPQEIEKLESLVQGWFVTWFFYSRSGWFTWLEIQPSHDKSVIDILTYLHNAWWLDNIKRLIIVWNDLAPKRKFKKIIHDTFPSSQWWDIEFW